MTGLNNMYGSLPELLGELPKIFGRYLEVGPRPISFNISYMLGQTVE